jgi:hypothetical protein
LICVNTASPDDPEKGFLKKTEWESIKLDDFSEKVAKPFTKWWVTECHEFLTNPKNNINQSDPSNEKVLTWINKYLNPHAGGKRTRKRRPRKRYKSKALKRR